MSSKIGIMDTKFNLMPKKIRKNVQEKKTGFQLYIIIIKNMAPFQENNILLAFMPKT